MSLFKKALAELASLTNPAVDAAIVAFIVKVIPGWHIDTTAVVAILGGVGIVSQWLRGQFASSATTGPEATRAPSTAQDTKPAT